MDRFNSIRSISRYSCLFLLFFLYSIEAIKTITMTRNKIKYKFNLVSSVLIIVNRSVAMDVSLS